MSQFDALGHFMGENGPMTVRRDKVSAIISGSDQWQFKVAVVVEGRILWLDGVAYEVVRDWLVGE